MRLDDKVASVTGAGFGFGSTTPEMRAKLPATISVGCRMRKRPAARSFLIPLGGRTTYVVGLGALSMPGDFGHVACFPRSDEASMVAGAAIGVGGGRCI
jgi:NAD(P)-dependent dehydrogenase (short-subunit alcohol dehydrogenase family)